MRKLTEDPLGHHELAGVEAQGDIFLNILKSGGILLDNE